MRRYVSNRLKSRVNPKVPKDKVKFKYGHNFRPRNHQTVEDRYNPYIPPSNVEHVGKAQKGYWRKDCTICGRKALYRAGIDAYCKDHRQIAVDWWTKHPMRLNFGLILGADYVSH